MSNHLAVAMVTETLRRKLQGALVSKVPGVNVTTQRPDGPAPGPNPTPRVNVFLYQASPNPAWRNHDLPARRGDGSVAAKPTAALDLHYLLSFYGDEAQFVPQRLLAATTSLLHAEPTLTRDLIAATHEAIGAADAGHVLLGSDLAEQSEPVRVAPLALNLEELSKLWSVFFQTPYALSSAYQASVVLVEAEATPRPALPVQARQVKVVPVARPRIERVLSRLGPAGQAQPNQSIHPGHQLVLQGTALRGEVTRVRCGDAIATVDDATDREVAVTLSNPPFGIPLRAGVQAVQVVHDVEFDTAGDPHRGAASGVVAVAISPTVTTGSATATVLTVGVAPVVGARQRVRVRLNQNTATDPAAFAIELPARTADGATLTVPIADVPAGQYFLRVEVDGAESPLDLDPASPGFGPLVTVP